MTTTPMYPARRRSKVPNLLFKIGAAVTVVSLILVLVGVALLGDRPIEGADDGALIRDAFITEVAVPDVVDVHLDAGTYDVVAVGEHLVDRDEIVRDETNPYRDRSGFTEPYVAIDRNGSAIPTRQPTGTRLLPQDGYELVRLSTFDVTSSGTYRIVVDGKDGPTTTIGIGATDDGDGVTDATSFLLFMTGLFGLGAGLGVLLLVAAGIWLYADRKQPRTPLPVGPPPSGLPTAQDFDGFGGIHLPPGIHTAPRTGRTRGPAQSSSIPPPPPPPPPPPRRPPRPTLHHGNPPTGPSV